MLLGTSSFVFFVSLFVPAYLAPLLRTATLIPSLSPSLPSFHIPSSSRSSAQPGWRWLSRK